MQIVHFYVNGKAKELAVQEGEVLTDTLRNQLGLTSVKKGCEVGECGACTVLIDGHAHNSCIYLTAWAEGKHILTVEGLHMETANSILYRRLSLKRLLCSAGSVLQDLSLPVWNWSIPEKSIPAMNCVRPFPDIFAAVPDMKIFSVHWKR